MSEEETGLRDLLAETVQRRKELEPQPLVHRLGPSGSVPSEPLAQPAAPPRSEVEEEQTHGGVNHPIHNYATAPPQSEVEAEQIQGAVNQSMLEVGPSTPPLAPIAEARPSAPPAGSVEPGPGLAVVEAIPVEKAHQADSLKYQRRTSSKSLVLHLLIRSLHFFWTNHRMY